MEREIEYTDHFGIIVAHNVWDCEYNTTQAQQDNYAQFEIPQLDHGYQFRTEELDLGASIAVEIAQTIIVTVGGIYGFIVPDHLLASFIEAFPEKEVYPKSGEQ